MIYCQANSILAFSLAGNFRGGLALGEFYLVEYGDIPELHHSY